VKFGLFTALCADPRLLARKALEQRPELAGRDTEPSRSPFQARLTEGLAPLRRGKRVLVVARVGGGAYGALA